MRASEIRRKSEAELLGRLEELRMTISQMTMARNANRLEKPHELARARRSLACVLTVLAENKRASAQEKAG